MHEILREPSRLEIEDKAWGVLEVGGLPEGYKIEFQGDAPKIKDVELLNGFGNLPFSVNFEGNGYIFSGSSSNPLSDKITINNVNNVRVIKDGLVVAKVADIQQSGGSGQVIEASGNSTIIGVKQFKR